MKDIRIILPNMASDTAGAASALFELDGLSVIHDAAGSMESYITFDERRDLEGRRTVASHLSRLEAITGNDGTLLDKLTEECADDAPNFIAIIGSPIPFTVGTDLDGIAAEAELSTCVPAFAVNSGGFELYDKGAGEALVKLMEKVTAAPQYKTHTVNLLGATPMDYSRTELEGICAQLLAQGYEAVHTLTMGQGIESIRHAAEAEHNLVISVAGLPAARTMEKRFGIPYSIGVPIAFDSTSLPTTEKKLLLLGETVLTKQLVTLLRECGIDAVAGITGNDDKDIFPGIPCVRLDTESSIRAELKKDYFAVVGDPLYQLLLPANSETLFIPRPHGALSGRLYPPCERTLPQLMDKIKRCL